MSVCPKDIEEFYLSLESITSIEHLQLYKQLSTIEVLDNEWKYKITFERKALFFELSNGILQTSSFSVDKEGKEDTLDLSDDDFLYLQERLDVTHNTYLKSRYSHLLWQYTKHNKWVELCINNYINLVSISIENNESIDDEELAAIVYITSKTKILEETVKDFVLQVIKKASIYDKPDILKLILRSGLFKKSHYQRLTPLIPTWVDVKNQGLYFSNLSILNLGIEVNKKIGKNSKSIYRLLAQNTDLIINQHEEESDFLRLEAFSDKGKYYQLAGDKEASDIAFSKCNDLKHTVEFGLVQGELDDENTKLFNRYLDDWSNMILENSPTQLLGFFAADENILVNPQENIKNAKQHYTGAIHNLFSLCVFDINGNSKKLTDDEKFIKNIADSYTIGHGIRYQALLYKVFIKGVLLGKINYSSVFTFLKDYTWFGIPYAKRMKQNRSNTKESFLALLAPGLHNLFSQFEKSVLFDKNHVNNYVLAIDSLTLKFEGALRDFIILVGGNTTITKKGSVVEQTFEELLGNKTTIEYFSEADIELFWQTFTRKGSNIRNNVAHGFYAFSNYSLDKAFHVFACIMRLGKYNFKTKE